MKHKLLGGFVIMAIAIAAAFNVNMNSDDNKLSTLSLANIEALAGEDDCKTAPACSDSWTISVLGVSVSHSCSVTCKCSETAECGSRKCKCI